MDRENKAGVRSRFRLGRHRIRLRAVDRENKAGVQSRLRLGRHRIRLKLVEGCGHGIRLVYGQGSDWDGIG